MTALIEALINAGVVGGIVALAAAGLTLIYGVLRVATFAHGDMLTLGGYVGWAVLASAPWLGWAAGVPAYAFGLLMGATGRISMRAGAVLAVAGLVAVVPRDVVLGLVRAGGLWTTVPGQALSATLVLAVVAAPAVLVLAAVGIGSHVALWRPLRSRGAKAVMLMIASIGLAFFIRGSVTGIFGGDIQNMALPVTYPITGPGFTITRYQIGAMLLSAGALVWLHMFLTRSTTGRMLRALSDNPDLALVTGIDVPRLTRLTWAVGCALAAGGGVLYAATKTLTPETGWTLLLTIFAAVILGGIGSVQGAVLAALIIVSAQEISVVLTAPLDLPLVGPEYKVAVGFLILIVTLLVRPQGLKGVAVR